MRLLALSVLLALAAVTAPASADANGDGDRGVTSAVTEEEGWHWVSLLETLFGGTATATLATATTDVVLEGCNNVPSGSCRELPVPSRCASVLNTAKSKWYTYSDAVDVVGGGDLSIANVVETYRGTDRCKAWYLDLMCRWIYPGCGESRLSGSGNGCLFPCRDECELYRETCPFPITDCRAFPTDTRCCGKFSGQKMPYNPHKILMPFSPIVFGLLIIASALYYWYVLSYQRRVQDNIRSRQVEYVGVSSSGNAAADAADAEHLLASRPVVDVDASHGEHNPDRSRANANASEPEAL